MSEARTDPSAMLERRLALSELVYVDDSQPGIRRRRCGRGFTYRLPDETTLRDAEHLAWIRALAIPPAWEQVWICTLRHGHLQATGRDESRRKQYRYHPRWAEVANADKFEELTEFAEALPRIRRRVRRDLRGRRLTRDRVIAAIVRLLDRGTLRVGNDRYAARHATFGATTLRRRHVALAGAAVELHYRGKSGQIRRHRLTDRGLAKVIRSVQELPGQRLFQYVDAGGVRHPIDSSDVNDYLDRAAQAAVTAKDFRTWHGSVIALESLFTSPVEMSAVARERTAVRAVARSLGNTIAVARKYYIHPRVRELAAHPDEIKRLRVSADAAAELTRNEARLARLLSGKRRRRAL